MRTTKNSLHHHSSTPRTSFSFRLERWHRVTLYTLLGALFLTGCLWLIVRYFMSQQTEFGPQNSPVQHLALKIHAFFVMPFCFIIGSLLLQHIRRAFQAQKNIYSGTVLLLTILILVITAYGLDYISNEESHVTWSLVHWILGSSLPIILWLHIQIGHKSVLQKVLMK